jgi:hypothetical protein
MASGLSSADFGGRNEASIHQIVQPVHMAVAVVVSTVKLDPHTAVSERNERFNLP